MSAISGTRRTMREMADGTIRVQIDIDPSCRGQFLSMFPDIDMPVALAPLRADFEQQQADVPPSTDKPKGGELARLAGMFCQQPEFLEFAGRAETPEQAADWVRRVCGVASRAELDHNELAAKLFHDRVRRPYMEARA